MKTLFATAVSAALVFAAPAIAQESSYTPGNYWTISMIDVLPGQDENYADYLAAQYKRSQDHAKSKGWIESYHILANVNARDGEPDLYLITTFKEMASRAEELRRDKEYEAFMQRDARRLSAESGARVAMRTQKGSMLLRELNLKATK
jgi:hypothetical protein